MGGQRLLVILVILIIIGIAFAISTMFGLNLIIAALISGVIVIVLIIILILWYEKYESTGGTKHTIKSEGGSMICPVCNLMIESGTNHCPKCGRKI